MRQVEKNKSKIIELQHEIEMIERFLPRLENVDIEVNWVRGVRRENGLLSCKAKDLSVFNELLKVYPSTDVDARLTFAGKGAQETYSPFTIEANNWSFEYPVNKVSIKYRSEEIDIWCDVPISEFEEFVVVSEITEVRRRNGRTQSYVVGQHKFIGMSSGLTNMVYGGGDKHSKSYKLYAKDSTQRSAMDKLLRINNDV